MSTYLDEFLRRVFSLLQADGLYFIYSSGLKVWIHLVQDTFRLLLVILAVVSIYLITSTIVPQIPVLVLRPEFGARFAPSVPDDLCSTTNFPYPYFRCRKRGYFRFRILANHLAFFLPFPAHWVQTSVGFHPDPHSLFSPTGREELTYITISLFSGQYLISLLSVGDHVTQEI